MAKKNAVDAKGYRKVGLLDYISYAAGDFGCNMSFALASTWLTLFYTQYMGIPAVLFAGLLVVLKVWDGINDPLIGGLIDSSKKQYKRGKFKTFIFYGSFGLLISAALCFLPVPGAPLAAKVALCLVGYMAWDACYTIVNVPYGSMLATISADSGDRAQLGAWRSVGAMVASVPVGIVLPMVLYDANQQLMGDRLFFTALALGVIGLIAFQFMVHTTIERVEIPAEVRQNDFHFFKAVKNFAHNRPAIGSTIATCMMLFGMMGSATALQVMFQTYFHNTAVSGLSTLAMSLPMFLFMPFLRKLVTKGKKEAAERWLLLSLVATFLMIVVPMPANNTGVMIFMALMLLNGIGLGMITCVGNAMMADAIDYGEYVDGVREEGTIYAVQSLFRKVTQGVAPSICLLVMVAFGYNETLGAAQPADVAANMKLLVGILLFAGNLLTWAAVKFIYPLTKDKVEEMETALGRNRK